MFFNLLCTTCSHLETCVTQISLLATMTKVYMIMEFEEFRLEIVNILIQIKDFNYRNRANTGHKQYS